MSMQNCQVVIHINKDSVYVNKIKTPYKGGTVPPSKGGTIYVSRNENGAWRVILTPSMQPVN